MTFSKADTNNMLRIEELLLFLTLKWKDLSYFSERDLILLFHCKFFYWLSTHNSFASGQHPGSAAKVMTSHIQAGKSVSEITALLHALKTWRNRELWIPCS